MNQRQLLRECQLAKHFVDSRIARNCLHTPLCHRQMYAERQHRPSQRGKKKRETSGSFFMFVHATDSFLDRSDKNLTLKRKVAEYTCVLNSENLPGIIQMYRAGELQSFAAAERRVGGKSTISPCVRTLSQCGTAQTVHR